MARWRAVCALRSCPNHDKTHAQAGNGYRAGRQARLRRNDAARKTALPTEPPQTMPNRRQDGRAAPQCLSVRAAHHTSPLPELPSHHVQSVRQGIFPLSHVALPALRPAVSRKKRIFFALFGPGGAAPLSRFPLLQWQNAPPSSTHSHTGLVREHVGSVPSPITRKAHPFCGRSSALRPGAQWEQA